MKANKSTNILIIIAISLLLLVLFKDTIKAYFKTREVLQKAGISNLLDAAIDCYDEYHGSDNVSETCLSTLKKHDSDKEKWDGLIKQNRDLNCEDFPIKGEAFNFQRYISGEFVGNLQKIKGADGKLQLVLREDFFLNMKCSYDPYGLDTDGDCMPCEKYEN